MAMVGVSEAAVQLGVSERTIRSWILCSQIEYVKIGRSVKIQQTAIDGIIAAGTVAVGTVKKPSTSHRISTAREKASVA